MALHFNYLTALSTLAPQLEAIHSLDPIDAGKHLRSLPRDQITLLCCALLKSSDICNPLRHLPIGRHWSVALRREWARQADLEQGCCLPVTVGSAPTRSAPVEESEDDESIPTSEEEGSTSSTRRCSAAQAVCRAAGAGGGGGVYSAKVAGTTGAVTPCAANSVPTHQLPEEFALARGQIYFMDVFAIPHFQALAGVFPGTFLLFFPS